MTFSFQKLSSDLRVRLQKSLTSEEAGSHKFLDNIPPITYPKYFGKASMQHLRINFVNFVNFDNPGQTD